MDNRRTGQKLFVFLKVIVVQTLGEINGEVETVFWFILSETYLRLLSNRPLLLLLPSIYSFTFPSFTLNYAEIID